MKGTILFLKWTTNNGQLILPDNLPKPLTEDYQSRWQAFQSATDAAGIPPVTHPEVLQSIDQVFAFSDFVAASCAREPVLLADLVDSGDLNRKLDASSYVCRFENLLCYTTKNLVQFY